MNAILTQSEQLESAGSFIPVLYYRYYINDDRSRTVPGGYTQKGNNLEILLGAGYHYNFVLKGKFYLALGYNSHRFFTGIYMRLKGSAYRQGKSSVITENDRNVFQAVIGFRIASSGILSGIRRMPTGIHWNIC